MKNDVIARLNAEFSFPFQPYSYQLDAIEQGVDLDKMLIPLKVGRGKTALATWIGFYNTITSSTSRLLFIVPASLVVQWVRWLQKIEFINGEKLDILQYQGTPHARDAMSFDHDCIVMSHQIFVKDYAKKIAPEMLGDEDTLVVYDEAQDGLRKVGNKIWRFFKYFSSNKKIILLSGTPVSNPMDTYAIVKLMSPDIYKTKRQFEKIHVGEKDYFGNVTEWKNLEHMKIALYNKAIIINEALVEDLPELIVDQIPYELTPQHKRLYDQLVKEEFLVDDNENIIDATETNRMFHLLQRFVSSPSKLNIKKCQAAMLNCVKTVFEEDDSKLVVFAHYKNTNQTLLDYFLNKLGIKAVGCWGEFSRAQQQYNKDKFISDPDTKILVGNPQSVGIGTDGFQDVCYRELFVELPLTPPQFEQAIGRVSRTGQTEKCIIKCLVAINTIQESLYYSLLNKDDLLQKILQKKLSLRELFSC